MRLNNRLTLWDGRRGRVPHTLSMTIGALLVAACAAPAPPSDELPGIGQGQTQMAAQYGGTFYLTTVTAPQTVHPHNDNGIGNNITLSPIYEPLIKYDYSSGDFRDEYKMLPWLAERWERTDPTTYLFYVRKGVKWQDGSDLNAQDVVWSLEYLRDPANRFRRSVLLRDADKIESVDANTVRVTSKAPLADFLANFASSDNRILPQKVFQSGMDMDQKAVGTGPFKLVSWDRQGGAVLTKNDAYWQTGKPYLDKVQLFYNFEASGAIAAFVARKNDVVKVTDKAQFDTVKASNPDAWGESFAQNISDHLIFKMDRPPFNDVRVRRAVHLALDRQEMVNTLSFGFGNANPPGVNGARKGGWSIPQEELLAMPGYRQPKEQDIAEAKRLLADAGHGNGLRINFMYNQGYTRYPGEAQMVAAQLNKSGFQITLEPKETAVAQKAEADGEFTMTFAQFRYEADGPDWPFWLHSKQAKARVGIDDADLDRLIDDQYKELDEVKRKKMWTDLQRLLLDKLYVAPLITQTGFIAYQPYAHGWGDNRAGQAVNLAWENTWVEKDKLPAGR